MLLNEEESTCLSRVQLSSQLDCLRICSFAFKRALFRTGTCGRLFWIRWEVLPIHSQLGPAGQRTGHCYQGILTLRKRADNFVYLTVYACSPYRLVYRRVGDTFMLALEKADGAGEPIVLIPATRFSGNATALHQAS